MNKNFKYYLDLQYTVRLKKNSDGTFFAEIEELAGCMTEGDTEKEALNMIEDAKKAWLEVAFKRKQIIPEPVVEEYSGKFNIRLPKYLHRQLAYRAKRENISLNTLITTTLASQLH